jgi:hypothetical protein
MVAIALLPAAARAQTAAVVAHDAAGQLAWRPAMLPPQPRLEPPAREVSLRWAAHTVATDGLHGYGAGYSRQISTALAVEGALDLVETRTGPVGIALIQLRATESPLLSRSMFVTAGLARILGNDEALRRYNARPYGLAFGGGAQLRATDAAGARVELQLLALGQAWNVRLSVGAFVGWGEK